MSASGALWLPARLLARITGLSPQDAALLLPLVAAGAAAAGSLLAPRKPHDGGRGARSEGGGRRTGASGAAGQMSSGGRRRSTSSDDGVGSSPGSAGASGDAPRKLKQDFEAAATFMRTFKGAIVPTPVRLELYALFKQAKLGRCTTPKPSLIDMAGRSKWDAWNSLGDMSVEEAQRKYVEAVEGIAPTWRGQAQGKTGSAQHSSGGAGGSSGGGGSAMGLGVSRPTAPEAESDSSVKNDIFTCARLGLLSDVKRLLDSGVDVNCRDSDGATPLHFAAAPDEYNGGAEMIRLLVARGADINALETETLDTPLAWAVAANRGESAAVTLIDLGADVSIKDVDGVVALDKCDDSALRTKLLGLVGQRASA